MADGWRAVDRNCNTLPYAKGLYKESDDEGYLVWVQGAIDRGLLRDARAFRRDGSVPGWAREAFAGGCNGENKKCPRTVAYESRRFPLSFKWSDAKDAWRDASDRREAAGGETPAARQEAKDRLRARGAAPLADIITPYTLRWRLGELEAAVHAARAAVQAAQAAIALLVETAPLACHCSRLRVWNMIADATPDSTYPVCVPTAVGCIRCSLLF